jgi:Tfp pilus assembly protein PilW
MQGSAAEVGFSVLELILSVALFCFVLLGISSIYTSNQMMYAEGQGKIEAQQNARIALETMAREVRLAGHDLRGTIALQTPATAIQTATASSLTFLAAGGPTPEGLLVLERWLLSGGHDGRGRGRRHRPHLRLLR